MKVTTPDTGGDVIAHVADASVAERLNRLRTNRMQHRDQEEEYKELRDSLTTEMFDTEMFIDAEGNKAFASVVRPEAYEVNLAVLEKLVSPEVFRAVTKPKLDAEAWRRAVAGKRIPVKVVVQVSRLVPKTPYVDFKDGDDASG